jgi:multicomponent Na+:H+ antiporter subunit C
MLIEELSGRFPYWMTAILLAIGLYGMVGKRNYVKKLIGLNIFQSAIIIFFVSGSTKNGATIPILTHEFGHDPMKYVNPLPHVLMLTAIVVSVAITGVALAFLVRIRQEFGTLDETSILKQVE